MRVYPVESTLDLGDDWCSSIPDKLYDFSKMKEMKFPKEKLWSYFICVKKKDE